MTARSPARRLVRFKLGEANINTPERKVALTLLAHPDDAEILCGGTLVRLRDEGWAIHIATCTSGDCGTTDRTAEEISRIRRGEAESAASLIGATYHCLGELDALVVYDKPTIRKAIDLFRTVAPTIVFAHAPRDYMMDHEQASMLARAASFIYAAPNASSAAAVVNGSRIPHLYYCDPLEGVDPMGAPAVPTTVIDVSRQIDVKLEMLARHASQREWLAAHHGMDEYLDAVRRHAVRRGQERKMAAAEAFVQHLGHAYPHDDLLARLFPPTPDT